MTASRRASIRRKDIDAAATVLLQRGLRPCAIDFNPDGSFRIHLTPPNKSTDEALDDELAAFEAKHGPR